MILVELGEVSWRIANFDEESNANSLRVNLDLVQEVREEARVREEAAKLRAPRRYNTRLRERSFQNGDLV